MACDKADGLCPLGCQLWWTGDRCDREIGKGLQLRNIKKNGINSFSLINILQQLLSAGHSTAGEIHLKSFAKYPNYNILTTIIYIKVQYVL